MPTRFWGERSVRSVANLTRRDGEGFFAAIATHPLRTSVQQYPLDRADAALADLRAGAVRGAAVLVPRGMDVPVVWRRDLAAN